jgi:hypothetical protein
MVSKRAAEFLAADLRAVEQELNALDAGIQEMEARREAVRVKLDLLKEAIGLKSQGELLPKATQTSIEDVIAKPTEELPQAAVVAPGGFRVAIRGVLAEKVRGMRPRDVHEELVKRGVPFGGKAEPVTRTYQELYRMAKLGQIRKRGSLYYAIQQTQPHAVQ